jgi:hypothetical protein
VNWKSSSFKVWFPNSTCAATFRQFQGSITLAVAIEESIGALTVPFFFLVVSATTFGVFVYYFENIGGSL